MATLEPKIVFDYFEEICKVPRPSKKEEKNAETIHQKFTLAFE